MRREWIEIPEFQHIPKNSKTSPSMRREWIEMKLRMLAVEKDIESPSMRREWIEITADFMGQTISCVSLHAEGVD